MQDVKVVIFDWDGTVMDSIAKIVNSVRITAQRLALPVPTEHAAKQIIGLSLDPAFRTLFPQSSAAERELMSEHYKDVYSNVDCTPTPLFDGAEHVFSALRQRGYQLAVATGKARRGLDRMFNETKTGHHFVTSRCSDEAQSKPHPQMLEHILAELQLTPQQAVMIGDSRYDLMMAHSIGMHRIGVTHGVHGHAEFAPFAPHAVIDNLPALLDILR
ncbi:HAD-IIIA family hydrolase [Rheinheimera texasensis]|uniref:HAD family hydrolase n=1 Tax=Rheinheimera texasensis TaxID=306205 RepID=UPI0032B16691